MIGRTPHRLTLRGKKTEEALSDYDRSRQLEGILQLRVPKVWGPMGASAVRHQHGGPARACLAVLYLGDLEGRRRRNCIFQSLEQYLLSIHIYFPKSIYFYFSSVDRYYIITLFKYLGWLLHHHSILIATSMNMSDVLKRI